MPSVAVRATRAPPPPTAPASATKAGAAWATATRMTVIETRSVRVTTTRAWGRVIVGVAVIDAGCVGMVVTRDRRHVMVVATVMTGRRVVLDRRRRRRHRRAVAAALVVPAKKGEAVEAVLEKVRSCVGKERESLL